MLPEISGIELARRISSKWAVSIIAMSASHSLLNDAQTLPFIDGSVSKPFEWEALVRGVHTSASQKS
jgi:DNA-binding response OmpR family regulator